jgi:hypothetical protein
LRRAVIRQSHREPARPRWRWRSGQTAFRAGRTPRPRGRSPRLRVIRRAATGDRQKEPGEVHVARPACRQVGRHAGGSARLRPRRQPRGQRRCAGRLLDHAEHNWPQLAKVQARYRGSFAYITAVLPGGEQLPLFRLRYAGSARTWGFAIYRASHDDYENSLLPSGYPAGTPQEALDCACGLYLNDHTAWLSQPPPTN